MENNKTTCTLPMCQGRTVEHHNNHSHEFLLDVIEEDVQQEEQNFKKCIKYINLPSNFSQVIPNGNKWSITREECTKEKLNEIEDKLIKGYNHIAQLRSSLNKPLSIITGIDDLKLETIEEMQEQADKLRRDADSLGQAMLNIMTEIGELGSDE